MRLNEKKCKDCDGIATTKGLCRVCYHKDWLAKKKEGEFEKRIAEFEFPQYPDSNMPPDYEVNKIYYDEKLGL